MHIAGIIAEYNPFHNGHAAQLAATRAAGATHVVAVMGGGFTQRGTPALLPKERRVAMALAGGVDLVLELPLPWAMAPAEAFATGGMSILRGLGGVQALSFGCECGEADTLRALAAAIDDPAYPALLRRALASGVSYAAARQQAAALLCGAETAAALARPNNTLAIEYIRAAARLGFSPTLIAVPRRGAEHGAAQPAEGIASGSALRAMLRAGESQKAEEYIPAPCVPLLRKTLERGEAPADAHGLDRALLAHLRTRTASQLAALPYISEGLENRLYRQIQTAGSLPELMQGLKTKRYPAARLRRILWSSLLELTPAMTAAPPPYIRVLGFNRRGQEILSAATPSLPLVSRFSDIRRLSPRGQEIFVAECRGADLFSLLLPVPAPCGSEQRLKLQVR